MKALRFPLFSAPLSRDKQDTLLLIASAVLVLLPHAAHLPVWVSLLCGATLAWRASLTLLGRRMPRNIVLVPVAALASAATRATTRCSGAIPAWRCWCCWSPSRCSRCTRGATCSW
jgi:hypothetical protein